jgi:hypothetical protein
MLIIGALTVARALIISIPLIILYYLVIKNYRKNLIGSLFKLAIIGIFFIFIMLVIRRANNNLYPISRDISVFDLYYGLANKGSLNTKDGYYIFNVLKIGIPFLKWSDNFETLEAVLGNHRYYYGWGTLHPTLFGWTYIDAGWYGLLTISFFGFFIGLTDVVRFKLPKKMAFLFLPFQLSFIAVLVRVSVQYAYGNIFYVFVFFIILLFLFRHKWHFSKGTQPNNKIGI